MSSGLCSYIKSTNGRKTMMGLTGLIMCGFVLGHMAGNLLLFVSPEMYNRYGHAITSNKPLLFGTEIILSFSVLIHIYQAIYLTRLNRTARPQGYAGGQPTHEKNASLASKTMAPQGMVILIFIILHLATFKFGPYYSTIIDGVEMRDLFRLLKEKFADPIYSGFYWLALLLLGSHLYHGLASSLQTLGLNHPQYNETIKKASIVYAVLVSLGFISQPLYFMLNQ